MVEFLEHRNFNRNQLEYQGKTGRPFRQDDLPVIRHAPLGWGTSRPSQETGCSTTGKKETLLLASPINPLCQG